MNQLDPKMVAKGISLNLVVLLKYNTTPVRKITMLNTGHLGVNQKSYLYCVIIS